jgi:hypothetical protein
MAEELGKIEKPPVDSFKQGRKLFFVPLVFANVEPQEDFLEKFDRYWEQAAKQITELVAKLGAVKHIYHELVAETGEAGIKTINEMNEKSGKIVQTCLDNKANLEAMEDINILTEFMDWNRCLLVGLQNRGVASRVYEAYLDAAKKRSESIARRVDETLKADEIGLVLMRESHQVQWAPDIQVFYIAPPALDEIKRWLREREQKADDKEDKKENS